MKTIDEIEAEIVNMQSTLSALAARTVEMADRLDKVIRLANDVQGTDKQIGALAARLDVMEAPVRKLGVLLSYVREAFYG